MKLRNLTELVTTIMEQQPETRSSDNLLYIEVLKHFTAETGKQTLMLPVFVFYKHLTEWDIPSIETQDNPHLKAKPEVEGFRYDKETEFIEFAVKG